MEKITRHGIGDYEVSWGNSNKCKWCGKILEMKVFWKRYCDNNCRQRGFYHERKQKLEIECLKEANKAIKGGVK